MLRARIDSFKEDCLLFVGALAALPASQLGLKSCAATRAEIEGPRSGSASGEALSAAVGAWVATPTNGAAWTPRARQPHALRSHDSARVTAAEGTRLPTP